MDKLQPIKNFTSSYNNEVDLIVDLILKVNELCRKYNILVEEINKNVERG